MAEPILLDRVRLLAGPFKERQDVNARYLLEAVESDRLLACFRAQAGLPEKAKRYGGWEERDIDERSLIIARPAPDKRDTFYEAAHAIPSEFTRSKTSVTFRHVATKGRVGTFGFRTQLSQAITPEQRNAGQR